MNDTEHTERSDSSSEGSPTRPEDNSSAGSSAAPDRSAGRPSMTGRLLAAANETVVTLIPWLQKIPSPLLAPIGRSLGLLGFTFWGRVRKVAIDNLTAAFPERGPREIRALARATFQNWGYFVLQTLKLPSFTASDWDRSVVIEGREHATAALERGKGVILISGHFGCFEMGAARAAFEKIPVSVVVRYAKSSAVTDKINAIREAAGYKVLCYDARGFRAMRNLRNNEIVCILIDQDARKHGIFVNFFGRPASAPPGPAILAARTGAALIPSWVAMGEDGKHHLILEPEVPNPGPDATPEQIQATIQELTNRLEAMVRRYPDQWLWMHRRWKTQPPA